MPVSEGARMRRALDRLLDLGTRALGSVAGLEGSAPLRRARDQVTRRVRFARGRLEGVRYRLAGRVPGAGVNDDVLTSRIRSGLGGLEKRLDIPRVHVVV